RRGQRREHVRAEKGAHIDAQPRVRLLRAERFGLARRLVPARDRVSLLDPAHPHVSLRVGARGDARGKKREDECGQDSLGNRLLCLHLVLPSRFVWLPSVRDTPGAITSAVPTCNSRVHSILQRVLRARPGRTVGKKSGTEGSCERSWGAAANRRSGSDEGASALYCRDSAATA